LIIFLGKSFLGIKTKNYQRYQDSASEPDGQGRAGQLPTGISQTGNPLHAEECNLPFAYLTSFQGIKNAPAGMEWKLPITAPPVHRLPGKGKKLSRTIIKKQL
jgi:hypothetical protein